MKREEYLKPDMQVILLKSNTPLLAGSTRTMQIYNDEDADEGDIL